MPAARRRSSRQDEYYDDYALTSSPGMDNTNFSFAPYASATSFESPRPTAASDTSATPDSHMFEFEEDSLDSPPTVIHGRKKPANYIPRPPNAFILFRSSFIKGRHVSTGVETNHSTLSKIIGLTWQSLPEEERQKWHARAKVAQEDHKRRFPQYTFRPIHSKPRGKALEKKKPREVGLNDQKRCAKIAELLVCGKKGKELEEAVQEFDKYHVPEIITRFEEPITASAFSSTVLKIEANSGGNSSPARKSSTTASRRSSRRTSVNISESSPSPSPSAPSLVNEMYTPPVTPLEGTLFIQPDVPPLLGFESFSFPMSHTTPALPIVGNNYAQAVSPPFDPSHQDSSRLSVNTNYPNMEEWTQRSSPISNSTSSMPSTPQMSIHFPEPYNAFSSETQPSYAPVPLDGTYCDYSKYPQAYAPISDATYGVKDMMNVPPAYPLFYPNTNDAPMMRQDHDFSTLMESLHSYSL